MAKVIHEKCGVYSHSTYAYIYDSEKQGSKPNLMLGLYYCQKCKFVYQPGNENTISVKLSNNGDRK